jgi:hypothetical protein
MAHRFERMAHRFERMAHRFERMAHRFERTNADTRPATGESVRPSEFEI